MVIRIKEIKQYFILSFVVIHTGNNNIAQYEIMGNIWVDCKIINELWLFWMIHCILVTFTVKI